MMLHEITPYDIYQLLVQLQRLGDPLVTVVADEFDEKCLRYRYYDMLMEVLGLEYHDVEGAHWDWYIREVSEPGRRKGLSHLVMRELYDHLRARLADPPAQPGTFDGRGAEAGNNTPLNPPFDQAQDRPFDEAQDTPRPGSAVAPLSRGELRFTFTDDSEEQK